MLLTVKLLPVLVLMMSSQDFMVLIMRFNKNPNEGIAESNGASSNCFKTQDQVTISKYGRKRKPKQDKIYEYY